MTVYDGVVGPWFLDAFVAGAGVTALHYVILLPPVGTCVHRVSTRTGHGFSDEQATRKMHAEFSRSEIASRHVYRDLPESPEAVAAEVFTRCESGSLYHSSATSEDAQSGAPA